MSITVNFYSFGKDVNSTAQPTGNGTSFECLLKEPCDMLNPVIGLKTDSPVAWNYCSIHSFRRYYFVREWSYVQGIWYARLTVDVLASWKTEIGNSNQYVLRSATDWDPSIIDNFYPCFSGMAQNSSNIDNPWPASFNDGYYVVGIINADINAVGAVSYYRFTPAGFTTLKEYLLGNSDWLTTDITEISANLQKELFNPFQYITTCMWFPLPAPVSSTASSNLSFGWWILKNQSYKQIIPNVNITRIYSFSIPQHPQIDTRGTFLQRSSTYSDFTLFFPPFGSIHLPAESLTNSNTLYVKMVCDPITGIGNLIVSSFSEFTTIIAQTSAMIGIPIQLAQINNQPLQAAGNILGGIVGATTGIVGATVGGITDNPVMAVNGALSIGTSIANAFIGTTQALSPTIQTSNTNGSISSLQFTPELRARFRLLLDEDLERFGRPYCKISKINLLPGFIKCSGAEIKLASTQIENDMIVNYMNGGFYYE